MKQIISASEYVNRNGIAVIELSDRHNRLTATNYDKLKSDAPFKTTLDKFISTGVMKLTTVFLPDGSAIRVAVSASRRPAGALQL